jgi:3-methyladenine DNA glycosylase/8-oxoguanine DNA glycosylase
LKLNRAIDNSHRQPTEELEAIKEALEMGFEYLDHPLAYKYIKDQVDVVLKSRHGWFPKNLRKRQRETKAHWEQLIEVVLAQEDNVARATRMAKI